MRPFKKINNRALLLQALFQNEIKKINAHFDGSGDSGSIDEIVATSIDDEIDINDAALLGIHLRGVHPVGESITHTWVHGTYTERNFEQNPVSLYELIEHVCYEELEAAHGGWEINAGSFGNIYIDVPLGGVERAGESAVSIDYNEYEEDYSDDDAEAEDEEYNDE
jgi:hypothetical protein